MGEIANVTAAIACLALLPVGCSQAPSFPDRHASRSFPVTIASGYGGENGLALMGPGRVLFSSGRIGTGVGTGIGPGGVGRELTMVQRPGEGWIACGLDQIDRSYPGRGTGRLLCMTFQDQDGAPVERVLGDTRFSQPVDLMVGQQTLVLAADDRARLTGFRFTGTQPSEGWRLPDPENTKAGFIVDENHVAAVYRTPDGCSLQTFRIQSGSEVEVSRREADPTLCQFHDFRVLRDDDGGAWLYAWTIRTSGLYDLSGGEPRLVDDVRLSRPNVAPGPITVVDGIIYFDAGVASDRRGLIGSYDPRTRTLATVPAEGFAQLDGPPDIRGLMPSFDGSLSVLVRNGGWATYPFETAQ